jgi:hypothetical protein
VEAVRKTAAWLERFLEIDPKSIDEREAYLSSRIEAEKAPKTTEELILEEQRKANRFRSWIVGLIVILSMPIWVPGLIWLIFILHVLFGH